MKALQTYIYIATIALTMIFSSCHKKDHLAEKPVSNLQEPGTLDDVQALLDNNLVFNESPSMGEISSDNYYLSTSSWQSLSQKDQRTHIWAADIFMGIGDVADWNKPYEQIFYTNVVLQALKKIEKNTENQQRWNAIQGAAFFLRGNAYYELSQLFMLPYDNQSASTDWGLPLRLSDNIMEKSVRSSVKQTYDQIISDISAAKVLLPSTVDTAHSNRPSQPAAMSLLSKIYLTIRNYDSARSYADSCLQQQNQLLDYNSLNANSSFPFKTNNPEIIFFSQSSTNSMLMALISRGTIIDSGLYHSYDANDLRRTIYFSNTGNNKPFIKSSYTGRTFLFSGLAVDEVLLIRAECLARSGNKTGALTDLNTLLQNRWKTNTFVPFTDNMVTDPLQLILTERRKELPFRNVRWTDIRRLNKEGMNITLKRLINGKEYELLPNSSLWVLPFPPDVIAQSNMPQNPR
jgi:starch-binding outer membrane protein, SusD/RagB family